MPATGVDLARIESDYDANGNLTDIREYFHNAAEPAVSSRAYDAFGRLRRETSAAGKTVRYAYDLNGNRTRLTDPDGGVTRYEFDALNRPEQVHSAGGVSTYLYDRTGLLTDITHPTGLHSEFRHDRAGRVTHIVHRQNNAEVAAYAYDYDANDNRTEQIERNGDGEELTTYRYTLTDALEAVDYPDLHVRYDYDAAYNRTAERELTPQGELLADRSYDYNLRNQLTTISDAVSGSSVTYSYDDNGNRIRRDSDTGPAQHFVYDVRNRLVETRTDEQVTGLYRYDWQGRRVSKEAVDRTVGYVHDGTHVLAELDEAGETIARYDYGAHRLRSMAHREAGPVIEPCL